MTQNQPINPEPTVDMDDTTGSNGGPASERFSGEGDGTEGQQGDDYTHAANYDRARSDTARIDGSGISGGTDNTGSSQSGGRSQY